MNASLSMAAHLGPSGAALRAAAVDGFLAGAQTSLWIASAITILGALLSAWLLPGKAPTPA